MKTITAIVLTALMTVAHVATHPAQTASARAIDAAVTTATK